MNNEACAMPEYQCHKKVWALKISEVKQSDASVEYPGGSYDLYIGDGIYAPIQVSADWYSNHRPEAGGYYVVYHDGYKSYSPAKAFEDGYTRI